MAEATARDCLTSKEPMGKRERNRLQNRSAILQAARLCFVERGYEQSTIRDIIRGTNLAAGTFYNYFSDKRDIFAALLTDFLTYLNSRLSALREEATDESAFVYNTYLALFETTAKNPSIYQLAYRNERTIRELFGSDILGLATSSLEADVRRAAQRGLFAQADAEYLSAVFFGVAYEMSLKLARRVQKLETDAERVGAAEDAARFAADLFIGGVGRIIARRAEAE
jgi:AcrR family transcriptional regulator